uniref:Uncharacterized protein n=1 Tax=Oryza nivara TaxID=4536 RepID=A0A0E0H5W9_ORYNI
MKPNIIPAYGCAKLHAAPPDYPCVARLRHRRLLSFLWLHSFKSTFEAMAEETKVLLSLPRLERLIARGMWGEAIGYACRFLPRRPPSLPAQRTHLTAEAQTLLLFLHMHRCFADVVAGNETGAAWSDKHRRRYCLARVTGISSHAIAIRRIIQTFVLSDKIRESMDWGRVREKVVRVVRRLRHVRQQRRPRAYTIAQLYLEMKRCVPSSGQPDQGLSLEGLSDKARGWMAHILDSSLRAGCESSEHHQWRYPLRSSEKKGAPVAAITQTMFSTIKTDSENSGTASATKKGVLDSIVLQTKFGNMTSPEKNYGFSSLTNAGTYMHSSQEDCHTENYCQGFIPRKHQREELAPEEDIDPKRQHTTLTFGEASAYLSARRLGCVGYITIYYKHGGSCSRWPPRVIPSRMNKRTCLVFHACDVSDLVDLVETTRVCYVWRFAPPIEAMTRPRSIGSSWSGGWFTRILAGHFVEAAKNMGGDLARRVRRLDASRASPGPRRGGTQSRVGRRRRGRWRRSASERVNQWVTRSASRRTESKTPMESMAPRASSPPAPGGGARARLSLEGRRERAPATANAGQMWNAAWNDDAVASAPERGSAATACLPSILPKTGGHRASRPQLPPLSPILPNTGGHRPHG